MKSLLFILVSSLLSVSAMAQIVVQGISPAPIANNYAFSWADPAGGDWATPDFNIAGTCVEDTLMLVEDGTPGTNLQGNPISQEGCNPLINNLTGKIAVIYRNSCEFGLKALNAQNAGAVGVIIINNDAGVIGMAGGANGLNVTIPVVMLSNADGAALVAEMSNGPVVVLMGNINQFYAQNLGIGKDSTLIAPYSGYPSQINNSFPTQALLYNNGTNDETFGQVTVRIENSLGSQVFFDQYSGWTLNSGDSMVVTFQNVPSLPEDAYTLEYEVIGSSTDGFTGDNIYTAQFTIQDEEISLAPLDANNLPTTSTFVNFGAISQLGLCMNFIDSNASTLAISGIDFSFSADTTQNNIVGEFFEAMIYEWNDVFSDLNDPNFGFNNLNMVGYGDYLVSNANEVEQNNYIQLQSDVSLIDNQRYLMCVYTYNPYVIKLGLNNNINYNGNFYADFQPVSAVDVDGAYYPLDNLGAIRPTLGARISQCPSATITTVAIEDACFGLNDGSISVLASGFNSSPSYVWSTGDTTTSISNLTPGGYSVTVTDTTGCVRVENYTISEGTQIWLDLTAFNETCPITNDGGAYVLPPVGGTGPFTYLWSNGGTAMTVSGLDSGTHSLTVTDAVGCSASETFTVSSETVDFSIDVQANPTAGVSPLLVIFDNQTPNLSNYNFTWIYGDGSSEQNNASFVQHTYLVDGLWDVVLIAEDINTGCTDTLFLDDFIFTTGGTPCTHSATINQTGPFSICSGDTVLLTCSSDPAYTYQWNKNGIGIPGANNDSLYVTASGAYSVTIYENNCPVVSSSVTVTVNTVAQPVITGTGTITSCSGGSITMDAGAGYSSYQWSSGGTAQTEVVTTSGNYTVAVSASNGCTAVSNPYVINASFMAPQEVCIVGIDSLTNFNRVIWEKPLTTGVDSFFVYREGVIAGQYDKIGGTAYNDLAVFLDQNSNPAVQAYRYKVTILDTCGTETPTGDFHKTIHLTINQGVGQTWNLIWSHYEGFSFGSYNIYRGTTPGNMTLLTTIASNLNSYTDLTPPGGPTIYYQIEVVSNTPCDPTAKMSGYGSSKSNVAEVNSSGISELPSVDNFTVYPNPNNGLFTIHTSLDADYSMAVYDTKGKLIMENESNGNHSIDLRASETGMYFIHCKTELGIQVLRVIKQ